MAHCPVETLKAHPLVASRSDAQHVQLAADPERCSSSRSCCSPRSPNTPSWPESERGDLLGECDLIMSFLMYNDISAMSRLHRSASSADVAPRHQHPEKRGLDVRLAVGADDVPPRVRRTARASCTEMDECMPHYYKITNGHGQGAETIMRRGGRLHAGPALPTRRSCSSAPMRRSTATGRRTWPCAATFWPGGSRSALLITPREYLRSSARGAAGAAQRHVAQHSAKLLRLLLCAAGTARNRFPRVFREHRLASHPLSRARKADDGAYRKSGLPCSGRRTPRSSAAAKRCSACAQAMHYALVALHIRLQTAAAYEMLGKRETAD